MARTTGRSGFKMRSGNKPSFAKMSGARISNSPANLNSFGFAKGTSPLDWDPTGKSEEEIKARQKEIGVTPDGIWGPKSKAADVKAEETTAKKDKSTSEDPKAKKDANTEGDPSKQGGKEAKAKGASLGSILTASLTGGLDAVYGTGKVMPAGTQLEYKADKDKKQKTTSDIEKDIEEKTKI